MGALSPALLASVDIEVAHDRDLDAQADALRRLGADLASYPATWFCTADAAERFAEPLRALVRAGHSIGCHGRDHGSWEDYRRLSPSCVLQTLSEATDRIQSALGVRPRVFRGPRLTTSAATHHALRTLGYLADFSVCSWRLDFMAASRFDLRWLTTGPAPYRPSPINAFRSAGRPVAGDLVVVPLSGIGVPLISGSVFLLGEKLMLRLAKAIAGLASKAGAPIVYLFHSYEFVDVAGPVDNRPWHQRLYPVRAEERYKMNMRFLEKLRSDLRLEPVSADNYIPVIIDAA